MLLYIDIDIDISISIYRYTVVLISVHTPCRICKYVNNFNKIREIMKLACYSFFNTDFTLVYILHKKKK